MAVFNSGMFFLGNFADMDPDETNTVSENSGLVLGTYNFPALVNVTVSDADDGGSIADDEFGTSPGEDVSYDVGAGPVTQFIDSTIVYNVTVELEDGSFIDILATAIQTQNGDVFLTDFANDGSFDNLVVRSFELTSVSEDNYTGFFANSSVDNTRSVCFLTGTLIDTELGQVPVEALVAGDKVRTLDHGYVPLLGVFSSPVGKEPKAQPVVFPAGALSDGLPKRDLHVSPQHRMFCAGRLAERMFDTNEVLISAKFFRDHLPLPEVAPRNSERYWHLICARHEVVFSEGYPTETMLAGDMALQALGATPAGKAAAAVLKQLRTGRPVHPARPIPKGARQRQFVKRMITNKRDFLEQGTLPASSVFCQIPCHQIGPIGAACPRPTG